MHLKLLAWRNNVRRLVFVRQGMCGIYELYTTLEKPSNSQMILTADLIAPVSVRRVLRVRFFDTDIPGLAPWAVDVMMLLMMTMIIIREAHMASAP